MPAPIKDTPPPDGNGHRTTDPSNGTEWVIVYDVGVKLISYQKNKDQKTTSIHIIETFVSPAHSDERIGELGFPPADWNPI